MLEIIPEPIKIYRQNKIPSNTKKTSDMLRITLLNSDK